MEDTYKLYLKYEKIIQQTKKILQYKGGFVLELNEIFCYENNDILSIHIHFSFKHSYI